MRDYVIQTNKVINSIPVNFQNVSDFREKLEIAKEYLSKNDKVLRIIINKVGICRLKPHKRYFETLVDAIISQQLSVKVADAIFSRFKKLFNTSSQKNRKFSQPHQIIAIDEKNLLNCGLSNAKVKYIKDLSIHVMGRKIKIQKLNNLSDEMIIEQLIQVKGIGLWTAQMFLIFCLGRMNVLPLGDLGFKKAMMINYNLRKLPDEKKVIKISKMNSWEPYCSVATWYHWQSLSLKMKR